MPYINLKTTKKVSDEKCEAIKTAFGKAIENFPGKTEAWLMVGIDDGAKLWFKGDASSGSAIVDVELLGTTTNEYAEKMTAVVCDILNRELEISPDRIYVKYREYDKWGWNGQNF